MNRFSVEILPYTLILNGRFGQSNTVIHSLATYKACMYTSAVNLRPIHAVLL